MEESQEARAKVSYAHQVGDIVMRMDKLEKLGSEQRKKFVVLPMGEWLANDMDAGLHPTVATLIEMMDAPGALDYPRILREVETEWQ